MPLWSRSSKKNAHAMLDIQRGIVHFRFCGEATRLRTFTQWPNAKTFGQPKIEQQIADSKKWLMVLLYHRYFNDLQLRRLPKVTDFEIGGGHRKNLDFRKSFDLHCSSVGRSQVISEVATAL